MAQNENVILYTAEYDSVSAALSDLDAVEQLHKDEVIGKYDAAADDIASELQEALKGS